MELKVYRSDSAAAGAGGGTRRRRGTEQPVHGTDGRRAGRARHRRGHLRLPLYDGAAAAFRIARRCSKQAWRDAIAAGARRAAAACRCSSAASRWAAGSRRRSRRRASTGVAGLVFLGYPLHPPGKPEQRRDAHLPAIKRADAVRPGHARRVRHRRRDPAAAADAAARDAARSRRRRPLVQGLGTRSAEAGRGAGRDPRRGREWIDADDASQRCPDVERGRASLHPSDARLL